MPLFSRDSEGNLTSFAEFGSTVNGALWLASGRIKALYGSGSKSARTDSDVYWRGIRERIQIESSTSDPWKWRRIAFTIIGGQPSTGVPQTQFFLDAREVADVVPVSGLPTNPFSMRGPTRVSRLMTPLTVGELQAFTSGLFAGINSSVDYHNPDLLLAKIENLNIKVLSDVTRTLSSGNDSPFLKVFDTWLPLNKHMRYADVESGGIEGSSIFCSPSSRPLGDVYIFDLYTQLFAAPGSIRVTGQATAYWHER